MSKLPTTELVARIRSNASMTQEELARQLGVSFPTVNAWERGRSEPRAYHRASLDALAKSLGIIQGLTVLIVEDDAEIRRLMVEIVEDHLDDVVVATATAGTDGLLLCGAMKPDLVLLDYLMPGIDGREVAAALRRVDGLERTRIIFVTAMSDAETRAALEREGAAFLGKPFDPEELTDAIDVVVAAMVARGTDTNGRSNGNGSARNGRSSNGNGHAADTSWSQRAWE